MHVTLTVIAGSEKGRCFTFTEHDNFIVGRSERVHFSIPDDKYFSRRHFMIEVNPPHCRLIDLDSRNGTVVNGKKVGTFDLKDGDKVTAGRTKLQVNVVFDVEDAIPSSQAVSPAASVPPNAPAKPVGIAGPPPSFSRAGFFEAVPAAEPAAAATPCPVCGAERPTTGALCKTCQEQSRQVPQSIPGYCLIRELGQGALGVVHLAVRENDSAVVAVKTITPAVAAAPREVERFLREAGTLQQLDHPNIVAFRDMGEAQGRLYFAMDYVPGADALQLLKKHKALPIAMAVRVMCQVLDALIYAHGKGIVHCDIKPSNLLLASPSAANGEGPVKGTVNVVKLGDFGLARTYQASRLSGLTMLGDLGGTPLHTPPERVENFRNYQTAADQYCAASALYYLLTGKPIFESAETVPQLLAKILDEQPVPITKHRPEISHGLEVVIQRALAKEPIDRFADVQSMRRELMPFAT
jgi:serine/threonine-protein kinase